MHGIWDEFLRIYTMDKFEFAVPQGPMEELTLEYLDPLKEFKKFNVSYTLNRMKIGKAE